MGVAGAEVGSARDDTRSIEAALVGNVPYGECVFIGGIADVLSNVARVRTLVDETLDVMSITISASASSSVRAKGVGHVDEDHTGGAGRIAGLGANGNYVVAVRGVDVVGATEWEVGSLIKESGNVGSGGVVDWVGGVDGQEAGEVEDLDTVANSLGADDNIVLPDTDLAPDDGNGRLWKTTEVYELASRGDLDESRTVGLTDDTKLTSVWRSPTP